MDVVMVHGFWDTGRLFSRLGAHLEAQGHTCHTPTLHPRDGRHGMPDLAAKLSLYIEGNIGEDARMAVVGFSMGAIVARYYLQALGGAAKTSAYFSIAAPYRGTPAAYFYPGSGTRQMRPGSPFLAELGAGSLGDLPVFTYRTPYDFMVFPAATTRITGATEILVPTHLHAHLPSDPRLLRHISAELARRGGTA
jgi:triacylglycerol lipase